MSQNQESAASPVKRGPGRPRKDASQTGATAAPSTPKIKTIRPNAQAEKLHTVNYLTHEWVINFDQESMEGVLALPFIPDGASSDNKRGASTAEIPESRVDDFAAEVSAIDISNLKVEAVNDDPIEVMRRTIRRVPVFQTETVTKTSARSGKTYQTVQNVLVDGKPVQVGENIEFQTSLEKNSRAHRVPVEQWETFAAALPRIAALFSKHMADARASAPKGK